MFHTVRADGGVIDDGVSPPNFMSLLEEESRVFERLAGAVGTDRTLTGIGDLEEARTDARAFDAPRVSD